MSIEPERPAKPARVSHGDAETDAEAPSPHYHQKISDRQPGALAWLHHPTLWVALVSVVLCGVIAINVPFIIKGQRVLAPSAPSASTAAQLGLGPVEISEPVASSDSETLEPTDGFATEEKSEETPEEKPGEKPDELADFQDFEDGVSEIAKAARPERYNTVREAAEWSCSTASIDGLSRQIIAQVRCINGNAYVPLPKRSNLVIGPQVFGYLQAGALRHLNRVLDANPARVLTLNSALRTLAQQYLVWRWGARKRCGVQLAAEPGTSNHEGGLAIDVDDPMTWRKSLEAEKFVWMGNSDRVHFDFADGASAIHQKADVLAFQKLWNMNHPDDKLLESGRFDANTERRIAQAPPTGFAKGARCGRARAELRAN